MKRILVLYIGILFCIASGFAQKNTAKTSPLRDFLDYSIFFIGDIGEGPIVDSNISMLKNQMREVKEKGCLVFLGNSISEKYVKEDADELDKADSNLLSLLNAVKDLEGDVIFIPGDKEWNQSKKNVLGSLVNLETFVEDYLDRGPVFFPSGGCPGPIEINLSSEVVLLIFDSQYLLNSGDKPLSECGLENTSDFLISLSDAINRNKNKKIVLASHHPVYSAGKHAGNFSFLGPAELYRKYLGGSQDFAHPFYKKMRYMARKIIANHNNIIHVSAHDNSLQFAKKEGAFFVVSGSGSTSEFVAEKKMDVALREVGFTRLNFYSNKEVWLEFWTVGERGEKAGHLAFREKLDSKELPSAEDLLQQYKEINFADSTISIAASQLYETSSRFKKKMLGNNYRKDWATPIKVPVFDIGTEKGGLKIVKRGGGQQTRSLRLEAKDGKQYVLRSVEKYTEKAIPADLQGTIAAKIVQDGISESYPYAALAVPIMAEAIGVYHTHPKIVYVPDDPRFGIYQDGCKNELFLFEARPKGDMSGWANFGNSKDILSMDKLLAKRFKNTNLQIDETAVLKARLFDIFLNDWDRHDDQWRWAAFKKEGKTIAQPIPRDRDQVFFYSDGKIPWLIRRKWAMPKFQIFDSIVENVLGLGFNARYFDRSFLQAKTKEDWLAMALEIKLKLTDDVIEKSIKALPKEVYEISGAEIIAKLKARREQLAELAEVFYSFLAKQVDVVGTNDREQFEIEWLANGELKVEAYRLSKKGNKKERFYSRIFKSGETKEVRIYALDGKDKFNVKGHKKKGISLRIIGGKGKDKFKLENTQRKNLSLYDKKKTAIKGDGAYKNKLGKSSEVNNYDRKSFKYDVLSPNANLNFVSDDGLVLGAGAILKTQAFAKEPYASLHKFISNYAFAYPSLELKYSGEFRQVFRKIDFLADVKYNTPNFQGYYYGLGNETKNIKSDDDSYNRIRMARFESHFKLRHWINEKNSIAMGTFYQQLKLKATAGRFVTDFSNLDNNLNSFTDFNTKKYLGFELNYLLDTRNNKLAPSRGIYWSSSWKYYKGVSNNDRNFQKMESDLRMYLSLGRAQRSILAIRFGAAHNTSGYSFAQANKLGLKSNLRGYRQERFAGDDMAYQNTDLRLRIARFKSYFVNGEFGLIGFNDFGRVWLKGEKSDKWHHAFGAGFWLSPYKLMVITANYSHSVEDDIFSLEFKHLF